MDLTTQQRIAKAIEKVGSQREVIRRIANRFGKTFTQQAISKLKNAPDDEYVVNSKVTPYLALVAEFNLDWLTRGIDPRDTVPQLNASNTTRKIPRLNDNIVAEDGVEYTRAALDVARAFMALPENERDEFKRHIETAALRYRSRVSDQQMEGWRAPRSTDGKSKRRPRKDPGK